MLVTAVTLFAITLPYRLPAQTPELEGLWTQTQQAIEQLDFSRTSKLVTELAAGRSALGIDSLDHYSLALLARGERLLKSGDREGAGFFARRAIELSPHSAEVLLRSVRLVHVSGEGSALRQLAAGLAELRRDQHLQLRLLTAVFYPILLAFTLAAFVIVGGLLLLRVDWVLRGITRILPSGAIRIRGMLAPIIGLGLIVAPIIFGPLWSLAVWSLVVLLLLPEHRKLAVVSAVLIGGWGALTPYKHNLDLRLTEPGTSTKLAIASGRVSSLDRRSLEQHLSAQPGDAVGWFEYAQTLRWEGDLERADDALAKADALWRGSEPLVSPERGVIRFLQGRSREADELFRAAEREGLNSAAFWYNFSRIRIDLLDTDGSRRYLEMARSKDLRLVEQLQMTEERLDKRDPRSLPRMHLSSMTIFLSLFAHRPGVADRTDELLRRIMPGSSVGSMVVLAVVLLVLYLVVPGVRVRPRRSTLYPEYFTPRSLRALVLLLPGGGWLLTSRPFFAWVVLALVSLIAMPLLAWPGDARGLFVFLPWIESIYMPVLALIVLTVLYAGYYLVDQAEV